MARALIAAIILFFITSVVAAQEVANPIEPRVTGFAVVPAQISQCQPVRIKVIVTNRSNQPIYSQRPYAGTTYNLYQTFRDKGSTALPDRYAVGVSLNGGEDGYPYRWGFRGPLAPARSARMMGFISLIEVGTYNLTASLLLGDTPIGMTSTSTVKVHDWAAGKYSLDPSPVKPIYPIINGRRLPQMTPYEQDGCLLLPIKPFVLAIGANLDYIENSAVISKPGLEVALFPENQQVLVNGMPVVMPVPVHVYSGVTYAPIRYLSPLLGETFYWYPDSRLLFMYSPGPQQSVCKAP